MNNKQLLFVFFSIFACNSASLIANKMDKQEALYFLPQKLIVSCDNRFTNECSFIAQHIKEASLLQEKKAHAERPSHDKPYWLTLSPKEKEEITNAVSTILNSSDNNKAVALQEVWEALYK